MDGFPKMEPNYKYTPHIILFSAIFIFQYFTKAKDIGSNFDPEQKKIGDKIFWKYMIVFQISKAADWCLGPYVFEFFESYHRLNIEWIGRLMALSFLSNKIGITQMRVHDSAYVYLTKVNERERASHVESRTRSHTNTLSFLILPTMNN